ncbi:hypothetical protein [Bacillus toyonensis]|uniref:hypothetical protein n=1 Tax=Bacillus toyonensis TaxID=155322 RepID=UPI000BEF5022|nr:hypothetical protein [Bacillus toyonensis]PEK85373.1 hypothetical protein CN594_14040 [Bacillus toyonensis]PEO57872.1 hypothetical protein CN579_19955 [Bacillus toyonensis]PFY34227.1 hypothetical protein COL54_30325 [Bacillus toyonensis]PFY38480.1 hypothetical protein COL55_26205 [Bacillus toyonensis]PFY83055.1 hypothetical protein COL62_07330 [Bacillus toyonensis]
MRKLTEYDLAYICYYSERVEIPALAAGFTPQLKFQEINFVLENLRKTEMFEFYKNTYEELLDG